MKMFRIATMLFALLGLYYSTHALIHDPWYEGPKYDDVKDAKNYKKDADALSKKIVGTPLWVEPPNNLNYKNYHCVGAHNAHVYKRWFGTVYQQRHSTTHQLYYGVRGFMWDTYNGGSHDKQGPKDATVILAHGSPGALAFSQKGNTTYQTLRYELRRVLEFMKTHPMAVVTILLEDYADLNRTVKEMNDECKAARFNPLFTPKDYESTQGKPKGWPTLGWMRQNNKRLVVMTQTNRDTSGTFAQFKYTRENQYGTMDKNKLCKERSESIKQKGPKEIVIFNNFGSMAVTRAARDIKNSVEFSRVALLFDRCKMKGWAKGFNQYYADRIIDCCNELMESGRRTVFHVINNLNKKAASK